jgi:multidrug efflux pump subunit AcrA (membrane-fusion protein)
MADHDRPLKLGLLTTLALAVLLASGLWQLGIGAKANATEGPPGVPVDLGKATLQTTEQGDSYLGQVNDLHSISVRSQVPGRVMRVYVTDGQQVLAGQVLFQLDGGPQAAQAASMAAMAQATRSEGPVIQKAVQGLQAERQGLMAELQFNQMQLTRFQQLGTTDTVARKDIEQYQTAVTGLQEKLKSLNANIGGQQARLAQVQAGVNRDLANARAAKATLGFYTVRAPYSGQIGQVIAKVGDVADPSQPMTTITRGGAVQVEAAVPVQAARFVRPGNLVRITTPQGEALTTATVRFVAPKVDPATQTLLLKADVPNVNGALKADEKIRMQLVTGTSQRITVPVEAVFRQIGQPFVYKALKADDGKLSARLTPVKLDGYLGTDRMIIASGLAAGDTLVVHGIQKLQDGAPLMDAATMPKGPAPAGENAHH